MHRALRVSLLAILSFAAACHGDGATTESPSPVASTPAMSKSPTPPPPPATAAPSVTGPSPHPLLWTVTRGDRTSHLFGTMHLGVSLDDALPPPHRNLIQQARVVVLEADLSAVDPVKAASLARLPADQSIQKLVKPDTWAEITGDKGLAGFPPEMLDHMQPWVLGPMLVAKHFATLAHNAPPMEQTIMTEVPAAKRAFLETPDAQFTALNGVSPRCNAVSLDETAEDMRAGWKDADALYNAYRKGDTAALEPLVFDLETAKVCPEVNETLLYARNRAWIAPLTKHFDKGDAFVAVGAAHLLGPNGVVALLQKAGFTVTRVAP